MWYWEVGWPGATIANIEPGGAMETVVTGACIDDE